VLFKTDLVLISNVCPFAKIESSPLSDTFHISRLLHIIEVKFIKPRATSVWKGWQFYVIAVRSANNESSEVIDILLPVTFYFNPSTRLDNVKNLW